MRLHELTTVIEESRGKTATEFAKQHLEVALVIERFITESSVRSMSDDPTWTETWTDPEPPRTPDPQASQRPLYRKARVLWVEGVQDDDGKPIRLGRDATCEVALPHPRVSRHHATIGKAMGIWTVKDHGSSNGTTLNGLPLPRDKMERLVDGDRLVLGDVIVLRPFFTPATLYPRLRAEDRTDPRRGT